jgi:5-methylcytosine-specific restriction endonuclease McrA
MKLPKPKRKSYLPKRQQRKQRKPSGSQAAYSPRWAAYSRRLRSQRPFCEPSRAMGRLVDASPGGRKGVVDHIVAYSAGGAFWDERNHMVMCKKMHDRKSQLESKQPILVETIQTPNGLVPKDRNEIIKILCG